jgi:hypothetical protein
MIDATFRVVSHWDFFAPKLYYYADGFTSLESAAYRSAWIQALREGLPKPYTNAADQVREPERKHPTVHGAMRAVRETEKGHGSYSLEFILEENCKRFGGSYQAALEIWNERHPDTLMFHGDGNGKKVQHKRPARSVSAKKENYENTNR